MLRTIAARTALGARRRRASLSTSSSVPATPAPKSSFELDDAPLFSLRTRIIFFSVVGTFAVGSAASFWLTSDQENAYWAYELCPVLMQKLGPTLGVPIDPATLKIDTNVLGPRDIRDLVGSDKIQLEFPQSDGTMLVTEAFPMEPFPHPVQQTELVRVVT